MLVALSAQRYPLPFQNFLHTRQARSDHRVVQRFADHARQVQPQLSPRGFPSILALGTLVHGGLLLLPNPIFRSGEECRHSNLNNLQDIAEQNDIPRKTAIGVFNTLESVMLGSVHPRGVGEFALPGLCKITLRKVPARKAGTLIRNPATGEMMKGAAKPASVRVRIRALSKLKSATIS